jgi:hypothetical protein
VKQDFFKRLYKRALKELSKELTGQLQKHALQDGWDPKVAAGLTVSFNGTSLNAAHENQYGTMMFDLEFGTETTPPKATIRKMGNNTDDMRDKFAVICERLLSKI